jgi:cell wall-associated NlpC family hydrolase
MTGCGGCVKTRRFLINKTPARIAAPLARAFLPSVTTASLVVEEARRWVGVPFRHQGRDRNGVDCVGLPIVVLQALGAVPEGFEILDYPRHPFTGDLKQRILKHCTPLPGFVPGCLVGIKWQRTLAHVAIYTHADTLIHALENRKTVIEHGFRGLWRTRYAQGAWALPGVRYG